MRTPFPKDIPMHKQGVLKKGTLLFLHANSYSAGMYGSLLEPLYNNYEVWAPDLPGHGNSHWTGRVQSWENLADYYIKHLERIKLPMPFIGMGHSIGGVVIMLMAIKRPNWFSKTIFLDPVLLPKSLLWIIRGLHFTSLTHLIPLAKAANRRKSLFSSRQAALDHFSSKQVFSRWQPQFLEGYVDHCLHPLDSGEWQLSCAPQLESSIYQSLPLNAWKFPKKLQVPSLFLIGNHSDTVDKRGVQRLKNTSRNHVVNGVEGGHLFPFEKPEESMALIKDFLNQ